MNIRIDSVAVNGLGLISSSKWQFKEINLIYGRNEQGKTYLVEYILRSLFKHAQNTRSLTDSGQVNVSGLNSEVSSFDPRSKKKLEDHVLLSNPEKPVDLSRLCVVKGGELSFLTSGEKSISKAVLKEYLSDQRILDSIQNDIPSNIRESTWQNGEIIPKRQVGENARLVENKQNLRKIDDLLGEVADVYSLGEVKKLKIELESINQLIAEQQLACRALAYSLSEKIKSKEKELKELSIDDLDEAHSLQMKVEGKRELLVNHETE